MSVLRGTYFLANMAISCGVNGGGALGTVFALACAGRLPGGGGALLSGLAGGGALPQGPALAGTGGGIFEGAAGGGIAVGVPAAAAAAAVPTAAARAADAAVVPTAAAKAPMSDAALLSGGIFPSGRVVSLEAWRGVAYDGESTRIPCLITSWAFSTL